MEEAEKALIEPENYSTSRMLVMAQAEFLRAHQPRKQTAADPR